MPDQNKAVEQLWYTWSDIGLDTIRAGFRIRAASDGLSDVISPRVKGLDRFQRYSLPLDANPATSLGKAPVCLALLAIGQKRVLVQKKYTGRDAIGRYGVFFIHLLDDLPPSFSASDAISLWKSNFWQSSDSSLQDRRSTRLEPVPAGELWKNRRDIRPTAQNTGMMERYLPYVIEAFLTRKEQVDPQTGQQVPAQIYIAAADDDVACLISGLLHGLPEQTRNLTFSTYEHDVTDATTQIVGTGWLSGEGMEQAPQVSQLLPAHYYQEKLAINCYSGQHARFEHHPLVKPNPIAAQYAQHATRYFLYGDMELEDFLAGAKEFPNVSADEFLTRYEMEVIRAKAPSKEDIEFALSSSDYPYAAKMLSKEGYRQGVLMLALGVPGWWSTFAKARLDKLHTHSTSVPKLAQALAQLARAALPYATNIIKTSLARQAYVSASQEVFTDEQKFAIILDLISTAAPPATDSGVWIALLEALGAVPNVFVFFHHYWDFYSTLMTIWASLFPLPLSKADYQLVKPLLSPLSWDRFGDFLALNLPLAWNEKVTTTLVSQSPAILHENIIEPLEQRYHPFLEQLLRQLSQDPLLFSQNGTVHQLPQDAEPWKTASKLFKLLVASHYGQKLSVLSILLDSAMGQQEATVELLLKVAQLDAIQDVVAFLKRYGPPYLPLSNKISRTVLRMFDELARSNVAGARAGTLDVLWSWLASAQLSSWLDLPPTGEEHLAAILMTARLNEAESEVFFRSYSQKYIRLYPSSATLITLFEMYARTRGNFRLQLLFIWLDVQLHQSTLEQVLRAAHLTPEEGNWFIEHYGEFYLGLYPESQLLLNYVLEYMKYVPVADLDIFLNVSSPRMPSASERFLLFLLNSSLLHPRSRQMISDWYQVATFVRNPALLNPSITECIARLLHTSTLPAEKRSKLMKQVAVACVEHEQLLPNVMMALSGMLSPADLQYLLQCIAETARDGMLKQRYPKTLYVSLIQFALTFKTVFSSEAAQETFVLGFLGTLLQGMSNNTFTWLNKEAKKWPAEQAAAWQRYRPQLSRSIQAQQDKRGWRRVGAFTQTGRGKLSVAATGVLLCLVLFLVLASYFFPSFISLSKFGIGEKPPTSTPHTSAATITPGQELYTNSVKGTPTLTLAATSTSKDFVLEGSGAGACTLQNGAYTTKASSSSQPLQLCLEHAQHFRKNFAYQATVSIDANGYAGGLVFFYSADKPSYYRFALLNGGDYSIVLGDAQSPGEDTLVSFGSKPLAGWQVGQSYVLTVIAKNQQLSFYIGRAAANSTLVYQTTVDKTVSTTSTSDDYLGVYAITSAQNPNTTVTISSLKAWTLQ